jgi:hypothetical protein
MDVLPPAVVIGVVLYSYIYLFNTMMNAYKNSGYTMTLFDFIRETYVGSPGSMPGGTVYSIE